MRAFHPIDFLCHYVKEENLNKIKDFLSSQIVDINTPLSYGSFPPLIIGVTTRNISLIDLLVENGADINFTTKDGWSPLYEAVETTYFNDVDDYRDTKTQQLSLRFDCEFSLVKHVLSLGANINPIYEGRTPVDFSIRMHYYELADFLKSKGGLTYEELENGQKID